MKIATSELEHLREEVKNCHRIIKDLQKKREFVGLTDEERKLVRNSVGYNQFVTAGEYAEHVQKATEFKLLEKNNG